MSSNKTCFVIMPFSSTPSCSEGEWTEIFENLFKPAFEEIGYICERAEPMTGNLTESIVRKLRFSTVVLADITDKNPNVFYELGIRHSLSKRTIVVAQNSNDVPSDLRGYWFTRYGIRPAQVISFKRDIKRLVGEIESNPDKSDNPVSDFLDKEGLSVSKYTNIENAKKLGALYTELTGNQIELGNPSADAGARVSVECLALLLRTYYVDLGPKLLKQAYELYWHLRKYAQPLYIDRPQIDLTAMQRLAAEILEIRQELLRGQYVEPSSPTTMAWKAVRRDETEEMFSKNANCKHLFVSSCYSPAADRPALERSRKLLKSPPEPPK
jgi:hypothetical protein